mgnify:CR=1 FL=1
MKGKGLTLEMIAETASRLVEEKGYNKFSVRELALRLNVKATTLTAWRISTERSAGWQ